MSTPASYEIIEASTGKSHIITPNLSSARSAAIALASIDSNDKKPNVNNMAFRESGVHLSNAEANSLCNWLLQNGYGDMDVIKNTMIHRTAKE